MLEIDCRTAEEIKARLACCSKERGCYVCPDVADSDCSLKLCADALALIDALEEHIQKADGKARFNWSRWQHWRRLAEHLKDCLDQSNKRIEELEELLEKRGF